MTLSCITSVIQDPEPGMWVISHSTEVLWASKPGPLSLWRGHSAPWGVPFWVWRHFPARLGQLHILALKLSLPCPGLQHPGPSLPEAGARQWLVLRKSQTCPNQEVRPKKKGLGPCSRLETFGFSKTEEAEAGDHKSWGKETKAAGSLWQKLHPCPWSFSSSWWPFSGETTSVLC